MRYALQCLALLAVALGVRAQSLVFEPPTMFAAVGSTYSLSCSCSGCAANSALEFVLDNVSPTDRSRYNATSGQNATLTVTNVQVSDAISIGCQLTDRQLTAQLKVQVYAANVTNAMVYSEAGGPATVRVFLSSTAESDAYLGSWYQGTFPYGAKVMTPTPNVSTFIQLAKRPAAPFDHQTLHELVVSTPSAKFSGPYYLLLFKNPPAYVNVNINNTALNYSEPEVEMEPEPQGRSYIRTLGSSLSISCIARGYPWPTAIFWTIQFSDGLSVDAALWPSVQLSSNRLNQTNGTLVINELQSSHRGIYNCTVVTDAGKSSVGYMVRVKSSWAPVWPAIGIAAEIIVLGIIVLLHEKCKHRFSSHDDDDDDATAAPNPSDEHSRLQHGDAELRQRNV